MPAERGSEPFKSEMDLVDVIGLFVKRRRFIIIFSVVFSLISLTTLFFYRLNASDKKAKAFYNSHAVYDVENDSVFSLYKVLRPLSTVDEYEEFVYALLFPGGVRPIPVNVMLRDGERVAYSFNGDKYGEEFKVNYNAFVKSVLDLIQTYKKGGIGSNCLYYFQLLHAAGGAGITSSFFSSPAALRECTTWISDYNYIVNRWYFFTTNVQLDDIRIFVGMSDYIARHPEGLELKAVEKDPNVAPNAEKGVSAKSELQSYFAKPGKLFKPVILSIAISFLLSLLLAMCLEFVQGNAERFRKFL